MSGSSQKIDMSNLTLNEEEIAFVEHSDEISKETPIMEQLLNNYTVSRDRITYAKIEELIGNMMRKINLCSAMLSNAKVFSYFFLF